MIAKPVDGMNDNIASADLQNPSDALEILAQVADRADDGSSPGSHLAKVERPHTQLQEPVPLQLDNDIQYRPFTEGLLASDMIYHLFSTSVLNNLHMLSPD